MSKMLKRRRKAKKSRMTEAKYLKLLGNIKPRVPQTPTGSAFSTVRDYKRKDNKTAVKEGLND